MTKTTEEITAIPAETSLRLTNVKSRPIPSTKTPSLGYKIGLVSTK